MSARRDAWRIGDVWIGDMGRASAPDVFHCEYTRERRDWQRWPRGMCSQRSLWPLAVQRRNALQAKGWSSQVDKPLRMV